jgi:hypothetical protein
VEVKLSTGHRLKPLVMSQYVDLAEQAWHWRHDAVSKTVAACELTPEERLRVMDQVDSMRGTRGPLVLWAFTYAGSREVVAASLTRGHVPNPDDVIDECDVEEIQRAALTLIGVDIGTGKADEADPTATSSTAGATRS